MIDTSSLRPPQPEGVAVVEYPLLARDGSVRAVTLLDERDAERLLARRWSLLPTGEGYAVRTHSDQRTKILMHREILGLAKGDKRQGDHVNGNSLDNRRANLRVVQSAAEQRQNQRARVNAKTSAHRGVDFHKRNGKWRARVCVGGVTAGRMCATEAEAVEVARALREALMPFAIDR